MKAPPRVQWNFYFDESYIAKIMNVSIRRDRIVNNAVTGNTEYYIR